MKMEPDDAIKILQKMFDGHHLEEYEPAFEVLLDGYYKLCNESRKSKGLKPIDNPAA